jgi:shikimate kinase
MNIVLVGFMGTGKSAVGEALARRLKYAFYDTDQIIEAETGTSIKEIFNKKGELSFRAREADVVKGLSGKDHAVIACGGGVVLNPENLILLSKKGTLIRLEANITTLLERLEPMKDRPLLSEAGDLKTQIESLLEERRPYYDEIDLSLNTSGRSVDEAVEKIVNMINRS